MLAAAVLAAWFAFVGLHGVHGYLVPDSRVRTHQRAIVGALEAIEARFGQSFPCIGVDATLSRRWHEFNYWYFLPGVRLERYQVAERDPCSVLVMAPKEGLGSVVPGARRVMLESRAEAAMWVYPGDLAARLGRAGWLLPDDLRQPLPAGAYRSSIVPLGSTRTDLRAGSTGHLTVEVKHAGTASPWPSGESVPRGTPYVRLGARWWRDGRLVRETSAHIPRTLMPGGSVIVGMELPTTGLAPGLYALEIGLVHEGVGWFSERGDATVRRAVFVR
jgi:hypothetical protein